MFKKTFSSIVVLIGFLFFIAPKTFAQSGALQEESAAPKFTAKGSLAGEEFDFSLQEALTDGPVVLYFFPSAYTGGCDLEAHTFSQLSDQFSEAGATIIGVSADDLKRLHQFSADPDFCAGKFPVASDPKGEIAAKYGLEISAPQSEAKDVRGIDINHGFIPRTTFVIDENDTIVAVFSSETDDISPDEHVKKSLSIVQKLKK